MKKAGKRLWALLLALVMCLSMAACGNGSGSKEGNVDLDEEQVDTSRTQLYVSNFAGGYGSEWLAKVKERYEELHKDDVYEEGKKGVQIIVNNLKTGGEGITNKVLSDRDEVYFTEYAYYYSMLEAGVLGDITEAVTGDMSAYGDKAGSTIEGKLTEEQKAFFGVEGEDGTVHYYGVPHYAGYSSLIYNVELFEKEKYYFADGVTDAEFIEDYFIVKSSDKKSTGPDGEYGTYDDGLPATIDEFYILCEYIAQHGQLPITWLGNAFDDYLEHLGNALQANIEGKDQMMLNYTMNGTAENLGTIQNGVFTLDGKSTQIQASNGYEIYRQKGLYHAMKFLETITTTDKFHNTLAFNSSYSHMNAQEDFLYAGNDGGTTAPIAMIVEGVWWESEATSTFDSMTDSMGEAYSKNGRKFAMMPLPKDSYENLGTNVLVDHIYSLCFMKANIDENKKALAMDFIMFVNSDESLVEFTQITNTPKALEYTMTEEELSVMSGFGRSVMELKKNSDIVYPYSRESIYVNQASKFAAANIWKSNIDGVFYDNPTLSFYEGEAKAEEYFAGIWDYYKSNWVTYSY